MSHSPETREPLAIVGIGCRLPGGVDSAESFWHFLTEAKSGIIPVPSDRWNRERWSHENVDIPGKMVTKWGGFIRNFDQFDAQFFGISPREAMRMDPQQRWLLETAWESLEDAGIPPSSLKGSDTAVFVGIASNDYSKVAQSDPRNVDVHTNSGSTLSIASNRIAYLLDFRGPAVSVDTACSSALVAINLACESIWLGEASMALAGGVNALLTPDASIGFSKASMLSPTGQCFAFDDRANGYVRGEGAGMFTIKKLSEAERDGDRIYCTIRAAVINQDGTTSSMTVPGVETQAHMLEHALAEAGIEPRHVRYMEAHGTGTPVGDPIETRALGMILSQGRAKDDPCLIGSVKTNVGHLESGSGVAGVAKAALALYHDAIPPNLNFERPNPNIPFDEFNLKVVTELQPIPHLDGLPPVVGVNSFGFGGTNSHILLGAAPARKAAKAPVSEEVVDRPVLLPLSARTDAALRATVVRWRHFLQDTEASLAEIGAAAGLRREHHDFRLAVVGKNREDVLRRMTEWLSEGDRAGTVYAGRPIAQPSPLVFVYTGQGAQWWKMGQDLLHREPVFRRTLEEIDSHLKPLAGWSLIEEMTRDEASSQINRTNIAQPAIFALQVALTEVWKSWGIEPSRVIGHSVGEVAAAYVAGAYTMEDAVTIIYHRSRLQDTTGGHGRMVAVGLSASEARKVIAGREEQIEIAVINSPALVTLAGDTAPLEELVAGLEEQGKFVRWLRIDYAFHTHQMDPIREELLETLKDIKPRSTSIPYISTVTGGVCEGTKLDAEYWWKNVRGTVLFAPAISGLVRAGEDSFLEIGPHPALQNPILECLSEQSRKGFYFSSLRRKADESEEMMANLARLHLHGYDINWREVNQAAGDPMRMPTYAWQHERYWLESAEGRYLRCAPEEHPLLGLIHSAAKPTWRFNLDPRYFTWLDDHRFWDSVVFPAAGYGEIGLAVARKLFPGENYAVEELEMKKALFVSEEKVPLIEIQFDLETKIFQVFSSTGDYKEWDLNAQGILRKLPVPQNAKVDLGAIRSELQRHFDHQEYYDDYAKAGYQFRPLFQHLQNVWRKDGESLAEIVAPEGLLSSIPDYHLHPAVLDACFHTVKGGQVIPDGALGTDYFYLPASIRSIRLYVDRPPQRLWGHARVDSTNDREYISADIRVYDDSGSLVAEIYGFRADRIEQNAGDDLEKCLYRSTWEPLLLKGSRVKGDAGLPDPAQWVTAANANLSRLYEERKLSLHYDKFIPALEEISRQFIVNAYIDLGWSPQEGDLVTVSGLLDDLLIAKHYRRLVYAHLGALEKGGFLESLAEEEWRVIEKPELEDAIPWLDLLCRELPDFASEGELLRLSGPHLGAILSGEKDPLEVLFPGGSSSAMERFYREGADFPVINEQIRQALEEAIAQVPPRRALRVLEVGAGTGSLTSQILPTFPSDRTEYCFTDNGPSFLQNAQDRFHEKYPFVDYKVFDCEKDPESQDLGAHGFDIVLASNVIHATADLKSTLVNLRRCLAPGGILLLLEVTWSRSALDNVFGLLSGWWRFSDTDLRSRSALLSRKQWENLLGDAGFVEATSFVSSPKEGEDQEACLVARAPALSVSESDSGPDTPSAQPGNEVYLVVEDRSGLGQRLAATAMSSIPGAVARLIGGSVEDIESAIQNVESAGATVSALIYTLALDHPRADQLDAACLNKAQDTGVRAAHDLFKLIIERDWTRRPRIFFLTRGTMPVSSGDSLSGLASAPLTGFLRVANNEQPDYHWTQIDLDGTGSEFEVEDLVAEVQGPTAEHEIAFRGNGRFVRRVHRTKSEELPPRRRNAILPNGNILPYRLQIDKPGILTHLSLNRTLRRTPGQGEIEVVVKAGGINFRDVMKALGIYPGQPVDLKWFGDDFSGIVTRVGQGVDDVKPGDEVVGMAPYCFRSYVTVHRNMVFRKPSSMSFAEAATLPTVFLTSHYAINELARMEPGESILIHAGTGGVGQAAIQIAQHLGLTIFSTAGSPEKRQLLHDMGVHHVLDSRSLKFADDIMEITGGSGVDAVLNSLAGDFIPKNLSVLKTFGRYLEIGKKDVYGNSKIGLEPLRNNISFFVIDLAQHLQNKPAYVARMFSELETKFYEGSYVPLSHKIFPITEVAEAFRYMAAGKHIGKNVLDFDLPEIEISPATENGHRFFSRGTYLITGGAGGFGLELARWMAENGARHFALMSRSGPKEDALEKIEELRAAGITVMDARGDVTRREDIDRVVAEIQATENSLIGVIHGAMVLDDEFIANLDHERFDKVLLPKMLGAWNLHQATLDISLDQFICFSSFSAVIGAVKQSNYNAGNVFLDQLAHYRHSLGLPALTFNWGALEGAGFVARNEKTAQYLEMVGLGATNMDETLALFSIGVPTDVVQLGAARCDWTALARFSPSVAGSNMFLPVVPRSSSGGGDSMAARILEAPSEKRLGMVEDLIAAQVGAVLGTDPSRLDKDTPLTNLGLDSLMAIELVNRIEEKLGMAMPMGSVLNGPNIRDLSIPVLEKLVDSGKGAASAEGAGGVDASVLVPFEATGALPEVFPLSEGQKALWFLNRLAPDSSAYNLVFSGKFRPLLDIEAMKKAFTLLFDRHPIMDTTFVVRGGEPVQIVHKGRTIDFVEHDCTALNHEQLKALVSERADRPFDLQHGPVVRLELFRTADHAHVALLSMHHIVSDAWSVSVVIQDLIEYYFSAKAGRVPKVDPIKASYADFVNWEQAHLASEAAERMFEFWKKHLAGAPLSIDLPTDRPRPAVQTFNGATYGFQLGKDLTSAVDALAKKKGVTLFSTLLSAYNLLMHRYCRQEDIVVGVPLAGRAQSELRNSVGYFINPVPLRSVLDETLSVEDYLSTSSQNVGNALENQQYPLARLVDRLQVPRDAGRSPLFQVSFSMEKVPGIDDEGIAVFLIGQGGHTFHVGDLSMETIDLTTRHAQFEITLTLEEAGGELFGCWHYNRDLFDEDTIVELCRLYEQVLDQMTTHSGAKLADLSLLDKEEEKRVIIDLNRTAIDYEHDALLHQLIEKVAQEKGDEIAVLWRDEQVTYRNLDHLANGVAKKLTATGVVAGDTVGVMTERSPRMIASLLGILKIGAAYMPLDPDFPPSRLALMLEDAKPKAVIASTSHVEAASQGKWAVIDLDSIQTLAKAVKATKVTSDALAYVLYTSGSTGKPKGVELPHRAVVNFLRTMQAEPGLSQNDRLLAITTLSFDISVLEIFLPLIAGATVVLATSEDAKDGRRIARLLDDHEISVMQATPATWQMLIDSGWKGRKSLRIFCGGEALTRKLANTLADLSSELWNLYGPTETTVWSTVEKIEKGDGAITIGHPIGNTQVYILDANRRVLPIGFTGDLWIGGDGLARGYRNRPDLTSEVFCEIELPLVGRQRLYHTGDLARWTKDGHLECLGRVDFQVKVHGVRMELGDIETQIATMADIRQAVVIKRDDLPSGEGLVGYYLSDSTIESAAIRQHLAAVLPQSYLPAYYVHLDEFPETPNRKIDRKRLPQPSFAAEGSSEKVTPRNETESKILRVFEANFGGLAIGVTDNFFSLGGDSLLALRILVELSDVFGREIPVDVFLTNPSIEQLARHLGTGETDLPETAEQTEQTEQPDFSALEHIDIELATDSMPSLDAVALAYIPEALASLTALDRRDIPAKLFGGKPRLSNVYNTGQGRIGVILLPCFEQDFYQKPESVKAPLMAAMKLAADSGASAVSLTGVIPSTTDHGRDLVKWLKDQSYMPVVTTGDATRSATIVKSIEGILQQSRRSMEGQTVAFVGLGSIGLGTLLLTLDVLKHPKHLILCDPYQRESEISRIRDQIRKAGFVGRVDIVKGRDTLPAEIYDASLIVTSANLPNALQVSSLRAGTLLVDYSFPPIFRLDDALKRLTTDGDILFTTGGELRLSDVVEEAIYLPEELESLDDSVQGAFERFLSSRDRHEITGCVLASLITNRKPEVKATTGPLSVVDAKAHYDYLTEFGVEPAKLQMSGYFLPEEIIEKFRTLEIKN